MIKAIIFDCFGVLAHDGWTPFKRKYIEPNSEVAKRITSLGGRTDLGKLGHEAMIVEISELVGTDPDVLRKAIESRVPNEELFEYVKTVLKPKYKIGLITNASYDVLESLFTAEQKAIFDASVLSYESHLMKPDKQMYDLMASRLGVELNECIYIDDQERYCVAAEGYGLKAIYYISLEELKKKLSVILDI